MTYHEEYRKLWINAGYPSDMGSACAVKPPPKEFRVAYHFIKFEHGMHDIENACIKATRVSEANDPFEFHGFKPQPPSVMSEMRKFKAEADTKLRLLCFSKDWRSPALWAHYADRHTGICLGFWAKQYTMREVTYHADRIDGGFVANTPVTFSPKMQEILLTAKAADWRYEEEIRRFLKAGETFDLSGKRFFKFGDTLKLSEVILGERCTKMQLDDVRELVRNKYNTVAVYKARSAINYFKMVPDERTIPA